MSNDGDLPRNLVITHATVIPWPISTGLHTWCGYPYTDERVKNDFIASAPEAVTCPHCAKAMRDALANLTQWVPRLTL